MGSRMPDRMEAKEYHTYKRKLEREAQHRAAKGSTQKHAPAERGEAAARETSVQSKRRRSHGRQTP